MDIWEATSVPSKASTDLTGVNPLMIYKLYRDQQYGSPSMKSGGIP